MVEEIKSMILQKCPCRDKEIDILLKYITPQKSSVSLNSLFVCGNTGTGKTYVIKTILNEFEIPHSYINCIEQFTSRHVYNRILKDAGYPISKNCPNMMEFTRLLKQADLDCNQTFYLIFDKAERLRTNLESHLLPSFMRLGELTGLNVCCVFITEIVLEKFFIANGFHSTLPVHFSDYTKEDLVNIMALDRPAEYSESLYKQYCTVVVDVFYLACRDTNELRHLAMINFSKYCEPIRNGEIGENDVRKLYVNIVPHLRKAVKTVYLRQISSEQWERMEDAEQDENTKVICDESKIKAQVELPFYSKYLLLAAYFASYNPATTDRRFFTKKGGSKMSKRAKRSAKAAQNQDKKFQGPKPFQLDRLMAIFYSITEGGANSSANILSQLSSLVTLQLLGKVSSDDQIDLPKYKCLVSFDFAASIAKQVELDMGHYLYEY